MIAREETKRRFPPELVATLLVLAAYLIWMLWVPAWPSQDGPVHLYYADVFGKLLGHSDPALNQYFQIRHLLPPYALYYYALVGLSNFVSPFLADRLIICCYLVSFVFGFRFAAKRLGRSAETTTLFATLLLLNWPLGMGFVNYCLALSFALWGLGLWLRFDERQDGWLRAGFIVLAFVTMLTHPVPLMLMLGLCTVLLFADLAAARWSRGAVGSSRLWKRDVFTLLASGLTLIYIKLFTTAHPLQEVLPETGTFAVRVVHRAARLAKEDGMAALFGPFLATRIYRIALAILLIACIAIGVRQIFRSFRSRRWLPGDTIFLLGLLLLIALPFIPLDLNGLFYFADRLSLLVWLTLLLAASRSKIFSAAMPGPAARDRARVAAIVFAVVANGALLVAMTVVVVPISRDIAAVEAAPVSVAKQVGFIMEDPRQPNGWSNAPSWDPYYWAAIHVIRHNDAILANAPWMDETILPVGPGAVLPEETIAVLQTPVPGHLYGELIAAPEQRLRAMSAVNFFVVQQYNRTALTVANDPISELERGIPGRWDCGNGVAEWYRLCRRR
ncbi:MAG TPA: hypothetical protein VFW30_01240 [Bryocella sp.]|nr:hypothetical protein [Bryocella sp.]